MTVKKDKKKIRVKDATMESTIVTKKMRCWAGAHTDKRKKKIDRKKQRRSESKKREAVWLTGCQAAGLAASLSPLKQLWSTTLRLCLSLSHAPLSLSLSYPLLSSLLLSSSVLLRRSSTLPNTDRIHKVKNRCNFTLHNLVKMQQKTALESVAASN